jgi:hypothetical protein
VLKQKLRYNYSSKTQTFGPGTTTINVTGIIDQEINGLMTVPLHNLLNNNPEFTKYKEVYQIFKIKEIGITTFPSDQLNNIPTYINMDWYGNINIDNIEYSDRSKIIFNDAIHLKTYYFKPVNMFLNGINLRYYQDTSINVPGNLRIQQMALGNYRGRVDIRVNFKIPKDSTAAKMKYSVEKRKQTAEIGTQTDEIINTIQPDLSESTQKDNLIKKEPVKNKSVKEKIINNVKKLGNDIIKSQIEDFDKEFNKVRPIKDVGQDRSQLNTTRQIAKALKKCGYSLQKIKDLWEMSLDDDEEYGQTSQVFREVLWDFFSDKEIGQIWNKFVEKGNDIIYEFEHIDEKQA